MILIALRSLRALVAVGLLTLGCSAGWAAAVTQTFTLAPDFMIDFSGTPVGSFSYDDAAPLTPTGQGDFTRPLTAFGLQIGIDSLALGDLVEAAAVFDGDGVFIGLAVSDELLSMNPAIGNEDAFFGYQSGSSVAGGAVAFDDPVRVPAPAPWALALLALVAMRRFVRPA